MIRWSAARLLAMGVCGSKDGVVPSGEGLRYKTLPERLAFMLAGLRRLRADNRKRVAFISVQTANYATAMGQERERYLATVRMLFVRYINEIWLSEDPPENKVDTTRLVKALFSGESLDRFGLPPRTSTVIRNLFDTAVYLFGRDFRQFQRPAPSLDTEFVLGLHARLCAGLDDMQPGVLRTDPDAFAMPAGMTRTVYASPTNVAAFLRSLLRWTAQQMPFADASAALEVATTFFSEFLLIHPFHDGNGRTARLLFNFLLRDHVTIPLSLCPHANRAPYTDALESRADNGPPVGLYAYVLECADSTVRTMCNAMIAADDPLPQ